jgi:hypothetical protein
MRITNVHERTIAAPADRLGELLNTLASDNDMFWPHENWPAIRFDRPLQVGATGGHGGGPYTITSYTPGRHIRFDFAGHGRSGFHEFHVQPLVGGSSLLRHSLDIRLPLVALYWWHAKIRPLHDAVLEDLFDKVEGQVSRVARPQTWSSRVVRLREQRGLGSGKRDIAAAIGVSAVS